MSDEIRVDFKKVLPLFQQRFARYDDLSCTSDRQLTLSCHQRVHVVLTGVMNDGVRATGEVNLMSLRVPGTLKVTTRVYEPSAECFFDYSTDYVELQTTDDLAKVLDAVETILAFDPTYKARPFETTTFRCERNDNGVHAFRNNAVGSACVEKVIGLLPDGKCTKELSNDVEACFLIDCHTPTGEFFRIAYNGETWRRVHDSQDRLTHLTKLNDGTSLLTMNTHDKELIEFLTQNFAQDAK